MVKRSSFRLQRVTWVICAILSGLSFLGGQGPPDIQHGRPSPGGVPIKVWTLGTPFTDVFSGAISSNIFYCSGCVPNPNFINAFSPLPLRRSKVHTLNLLVSNRSGSYGQQLLLTVEVRDFAGNLRRTVSSTLIDLETVPQRVFVAVPISTNPANTLLFPGEYLAAHVVGASGSGGSLQLQVHLAAEVTSP